MLGNMRVVSFCHFLQGPAALQYRADIGAELVKVEPPSKGKVDFLEDGEG
jgi:crotonobetainyl-CoA:carnitine CoA-transferase CaiB-like acyl-CoA transferase